MKKGLLLAGAVFSLGILAQSANAVTMKISEDQVLKFGARGIIDATIAGKRTKDDKSDLQFTHRNARIYFKYRLNKMISFGFQTEFFAKTLKADKNKPKKTYIDNKIEILDSFINIALAPELNVIAGSYKVPFERHSGLQSGWSVLFPTGPTYTGNALTTFTQKLVNGKYKYIKHAFTNPVEFKPFRSGSRSAGLTIWGNIADGMFKYYAGIFDVNDEVGAPNEAKTAYAIRVQFTPTMLGYKPEKGYVLKNTYVGKKDVLSVGVSFAYQPYRNKRKNKDDQSSWGVDVMWEQKFGTLVPNLQVGYVTHNNWEANKNDDRTGWLVQGQLLYDQKVLIGKPALVARWVRTDFKKEAFKTAGDPSLTTWGIGVNYYIKGYANRISLAVDTVDPDGDLQKVARTKGSWTDVTLSIFYNF
ncbi:hypothetical protein [Aquifex sp.]